jgi:CDP-diacylglycerol---glycerol-3-phosphate 3-phosphatidyltransferase
MISVYDLKPKFQNLLRPIVGLLAQIGVTANQVTLFAMFLSIGTGILLVIYSDCLPILFIIPVVLFLRMGLNAMDGMLAREYQMESPLGAILNELGDVVSDTALYLPIALMGDIHPLSVIGFVVLSIISEMTGVISIQIGASRRYDGPMGKSDRALWVGILSIIMALGLFSSFVYSLVIYFLSILVLFTIVNRVQKSLGELR